MSGPRALRINHGANVGRAVLHSGTVGAALTAKIRDTRALAVSLDVALHPTGERHWATAGGLLAPVLELLLGAPDGTVLSLNVPDRPAAELGPMRHARLARGGAVQTRVEEVRDGGVRLSEVEVSDEPEEGTDSALLDAAPDTDRTAVGRGRRRRSGASVVVRRRPVVLPNDD